MPNIEDINVPVTVRASVNVPRLARAAGAGALELPVTGRDADFVRTYARLSARGQDLVLAYPWQHDEELSYRLPSGWRLAMGAPPPARVVDSPFGSFRLEVAAERGVRARAVVVERHARARPPRRLRAVPRLPAGGRRRAQHAAGRDRGRGAWLVILARSFVSCTS